ncbi:MAG: hypothetical protein GC190_21010 [Alphaproteobacteria bacterium]|nr:hypothetical protein [Alphaproteobacteria bacterium]
MTAGRCAISTIVVATAVWLAAFGWRFHAQESMSANGLIPVLLGTNVVRPYDPAPLVELKAGLSGAEFDRALHNELAKRLGEERAQQVAWNLGPSGCAATNCRIPFMETLSRAEHREDAYRIYAAVMEETKSNAYARIPKWLIRFVVPLAIILSSGISLLIIAAGVWKVPLSQLSAVRRLSVAALLSAGWVAVCAYAVPVQTPVRIDKIEMLGRYPSYFEIPIYQTIGLPFGVGFLELDPGLDWTEFRRTVSTEIDKQIRSERSAPGSVVGGALRAAAGNEARLRSRYASYVELNREFLDRRRKEWVNWLGKLLAVPAALLLALCALVAASRAIGGRA